MLRDPGKPISPRVLAGSSPTWSAGAGSLTLSKTKALATSMRMRHLAREDVVRELAYTGRIFSADEALAYGFATRLVKDPWAAAMATARDIAARSPDAIRAAKRLLNQAVACEARAGLVAETAEQQRLIGTPNQIEAVRANLETRLPSFANA
jgi:enoyl-CoA hydratase/carnithine racemase